MEKDKIAFHAIKDICAKCPKLNSCPFGQPALETFEIVLGTEDRKSAISYIWNKNSEKTLNICPKPDEIIGAVKLLQKP